MAVNRLGEQNAAALGGLAGLAQQLRSQRLGRIIVLQGIPQQRAQVAQALGKELGAVVSKYIGETEKNLTQAFAAANHAGAILFFDEADALLGKRTEVKDSHDRYADLSRLLPTFLGILLLGVNHKENLPDGLLLKSQVVPTQDYWPPR
jgi:hypothetical protein